MPPQGYRVALGDPWSAAVAWAVTAAGLEVERPGVAPVAWAEIEQVHQAAAAPRSKIRSAEELLAACQAERRRDQTIVFTNGCFDLLHAGHLQLLQGAAEQGDRLVVAINSDSSIRRLKGTGRPFIPEQQRAALLAALECVWVVIIFDEETPIPLLQMLQPEVLVKGSEYTLSQVVGSDVVIGYGGQVVTVPMLPGVSTTQLAAACHQRIPMGTGFNNGLDVSAVGRPVA